MQFEFHYEMNEIDAYQFACHHNFNSPNAKWAMLKMRLAVALGLYLPGVLLPNLFPEEFPRAWFFGVLAVVGAIFFPQFYRLINKMVIKAQGKADRRLFHQGAFTYSFAEDSFTFLSPTTTAQNAYSALERVDIGKEAVYLYINSTSANILPKRCFADSAEQERFVAFIRGKIEQSKTVSA